MAVHGNSWSEQKKIEVATAHCMGLKAPMIEAATGVPRQTIRHWRTMDWFKELVAEMQREEDIEVDAQFSKILNKALNSVVDRLENGEFMYDPKKGTFIRRPVYLKDISKVADLVFDKRNLLRGKPTSISAKQEQITDRLAKLALEFERFVNAKEVKGELVNDNELRKDANGNETGHEEKDEKRTNANDGSLLTVSGIQEEKEVNAVHEERQERLQDRVS